MSDSDYAARHRRDNTTTAEDPTAVVFDELRRRYLPPGFIESLIRTWVTVGIGTGIAWLARRYGIVVDPTANTTVTAVSTALCIAGYYALCRLVEARFPRIGSFLISLGLIQSKPVYAQPDEAVRLIDVRTAHVRRVAPSRTPDLRYPFPPSPRP